MNLLTQRVNISGTPIEGPLVGITTLADLINKLTSFVYPLAGILLFIYLVWGGYDFLLSGGREEKIKSGQGRITGALIGFLLLFISYLLVRLIEEIFGLKSGIFK